MGNQRELVFASFEFEVQVVGRGHRRGEETKDGVLVVPFERRLALYLPPAVVLGRVAQDSGHVGPSLEPAVLDAHCGPGLVVSWTQKTANAVGL